MSENETIKHVAPAGPRQKATPRPSSVAKRSMIIDSALLLFAEHGFAGVSLRLVAGHARVPLSTLVHHFKDKKTLFDQAVTRAFERTTIVFDSILDENANAEVRLRHLLQRLMSFQLIESPEMRIIDQALLNIHVSTNISITDPLNENHEKVKKLFCQAAGSASGYEWHELREIAIGLSFGVVKFRRLQAQLMNGENSSGDSEFIRKTTDFYLSGIGLGSHNSKRSE